MIQSAWSKQRDCYSFASKVAFLEKYLAVSILNGSSIEYHEKKHRRFNLSGNRFGSRAIQISGAVENELLLTGHRKTHQIVQIRHFEPQKFCITSKQFKEARKGF